MNANPVILVDARGVRATGVPRNAVSLDRAGELLARRRGKASLAVWIGRGPGADSRIRVLVREARLPSVSIGTAGGPAERRRSASLGFAAHLAGRIAGAEASRTARRLAALAGEGRRSSGRAKLSEEVRTARRLKILSDIARAANSVLDPKRVMEVVMSKAQSLIRSEAWSLLLVDEKEQSLSFAISKGDHSGAIKDFKLGIGQGIAGWVVRYRRPVIINDVRRDKRFDPSLDRMTGFRTRSILCAPLLSRGRIIGVVELLNKKRGRFTREDMVTLKLLVEPGAVAIENAILYKRSTELSFTDDLTQLFNGRYLNLALKREVKRARRYRTPVSVIFLDLDGFKHVNDSHGHLVGSRALVEVGQVIRGTVREIDIVSRYGGDEFTVVLPQTGPEGAEVIAERIRRNIEETIFLSSMGHQVRLTASLGVASHPDHARNQEELIQKADQAMYQIKDDEKNGVALAR
jgi:diguanylate cyclase (GGDEF)-like protein